MQSAHLILLFVTSVFRASVFSGVLQSPTFTLNSSHSAVLPREAVQFNCTSLNTTCISANFSLYKNEESIKTQTAESSTTFSLTVDSSHQGQYSCDYSCHENITSPRSRSINVTVVSLLQPNITLSAPDGWFHWWLQRSEVIRGYSFSITCSIEPQYPGGSIHLEFSGSINRSLSAVNHSTTFFFPKADFVHQGSYSCVYEVTVSSRTFSSPTTELLAVTVKVSPVPFIGSGVAAGLLLILVPIIIVLIKRCQKRKGAKTKCGITNTGNETDDNDYENTEVIVQKKDHRQDSHFSDEEYINIHEEAEKMAMDNDYEDDEIYTMGD
ncbi:uncharacterized protein LOC108444005 [Pygocentrus nattereri]|uniref:uncharacterized protein LOC108444005 n=1 Tax=Pygocentrus nattereri TaxID=42514 RepID=UPI001890CACC|nr:uncharacterized protein LOC108444005 [Pygocentrus nattereri]